MLALAVAMALAAAPPPARAPAAPVVQPKLATVTATYMFDLATPAGVLGLSWPAMAYDRAKGELFIVAEGFVRIFDATGMEVHRFGDDGSLGYIMRVAVMEDGEIIALTSFEGKKAIIRCDFRGTRTGELQLEGLPPGFQDFEPDQLVYGDERLYFAERGKMRVVIADVMGVVRHTMNLRDYVAAAIGNDIERKPPGAMDGFNVDASGNVLFTMSTMFAGAIVSPTGQIRMFGSRGSTPGRFNIIGGITVDENGYIYVADRLRSIVSVWDSQLHFLTEFGYRGPNPENITTPFEIAVGSGRVYVTQVGNRPVKVFRVEINDPERPAVPPPPPPPAKPDPRPKQPAPRTPEAVG